MLVYRGPNAPVAAVFAGLEGKYAWIEWRLPDSEISIRYVPGRDTVPFMIVTGSALTIMMTDEVTVPYGTLWSAGGPR